MHAYRRVTLKDRIQIDTYLSAGFTRAEIALKLGFHKSTITRELKRNFYGTAYTPEKADKLAAQRRILCRKRYRVSGKLEAFVEYFLAQGWSPEQVAGRLKLERRMSCAANTIYRFTRRRRSLRVYLRFYNRRGAGRWIQRRRKRPQWHLRIQARPKGAHNRTRFGHWERDTMHTNIRSKVLVCTERKSRYTKLGKVKGRTSEAVNNQTLELLAKTQKKIHSLTNDNGTEFNVSKNLGVPVYFCDPLKPQQRGTVENTIGLLRQYIPNKTNLDEWTDCDIQALEDKINLRPRKCLDFKTPLEVFFNIKVALTMEI